MNMSKEDSVRWMAGFFDGEGNIGIGKMRAGAIPRSKSPSYGLGVQIGNSSREAIELLASGLGAKVREGLTRHGRKYYCCSTSGRRAMTFLEAVYPFCIVKRHEIDIARKFMGLPRPERGRRGHTVPQLLTEAREQCMQELMKLHLKGWKRG